MSSKKRKRSTLIHLAPENQPLPEATAPSASTSTARTQVLREKTSINQHDGQVYQERSVLDVATDEQPASKLRPDVPRERRPLYDWNGDRDDGTHHALDEAEEDEARALRESVGSFAFCRRPSSSSVYRMTLNDNGQKTIKSSFSLRCYGSRGVAITPATLPLVVGVRPPRRKTVVWQTIVATGASAAGSSCVAPAWWRPTASCLSTLSR